MKITALALLCLSATACGAASQGTGPGTAYGEGAPLPRENAIPKAPRPAMNATAAQAYQAGLHAFDTGDLRGAESLFRQATIADPAAFQAHFALGSTLETLGSRTEALAAYQQSLRRVPDFEPAIMAIAQMYLRLGEVSQAEVFLNRQLSQVPNSAAALAALAEVKSVQKDSAAAQSLAQRALKRSPDYRPAMVVLARDHYRNRRLDLALYALTAILDGYGPENPPRDKNNAEARLLRGLIHKEQGQRKAAFDDFARAVELRPDLVEARLNLAAYMLESGNAEQAVPVLEAALAYDPANVLVHLNLGDAYRLQGRPDEAIKQLEWVAQAAPNLPQVHYNLGLVYMLSKIDTLSPEQALDRAIAEFEAYLELQPRARPGAGDDAKELLARARNKKSVLKAMSGGPQNNLD